jgi:hypothetical protein
VGARSPDETEQPTPATLPRPRLRGSLRCARASRAAPRNSHSEALAWSHPPVPQVCHLSSGNRSRLLSRGLSFTDWVSAKWFRAGHSAPTYADSSLTPLVRFPLNTYDTDDPQVDLDSWRLQVFIEESLDMFVCANTDIEHPSTKITTTLTFFSFRGTSPEYGRW